jgi:glutamine cyclotransferase
VRRTRAPWIAATVIAALGAVVYVSTGADSRPSQAAAVAPPQATPVHGYDVVRQYPHDADAFSQGLIYRDGFLYESTGLNGRSSLRLVELATGRVVQRREVSADHFAEGLVDWGAELIQLTYLSNLAFVYDLKTFEPRGSFPYPGEGWGLTRDDRRLIMSDGTSQLRFWDPVTRRELGRVAVTDRGVPVDDLNELEYVKGRIYANVWHSDRIAVIDPGSGAVTAWIDLTGLRPPSARDPEAVLNGIAYDPSNDRLFVTGKLWPALFEIRVRPALPK